MGNINIPNIQLMKLRLSVFMLLTSTYLTEPSNPLEYKLLESKDLDSIIHCQAPRVVNIVHVATQ